MLIDSKRLMTATARGKLKAQKEPHWTAISEHVHLGLAKGKHRSSWIVRQRIDGRYRSKKLGLCEDCDANGVSFGQARDAISAPETKKATLSVWTVDDAIEHYRDQKGTVSKDTDQRLRRLSKELGSQKCESLDKAFLTKWRNKLVKARVDAGGDGIERRAKESMNRLFSNLRAVLSESYDDDKFSNDGFKKVKPFPDTGRARTTTFTKTQAKRLLENIEDDDFRLLVACTLASGARFGELTKARVQNFSSRSGTITFTETKSKRVRHTPMTDEGVALFSLAAEGKGEDELLFQNAAGNPWNKTESMRQFRAACKESNFKKQFIFHDLRRTAGSWLAEAGVSIQIIADFLGHADPRITFQHYSHIRPSHAKQLIRENLPMLGVI